MVCEIHWSCGQGKESYSWCLIPALERRLIDWIWGDTDRGKCCLQAIYLIFSYVTIS